MQVTLYFASILLTGLLTAFLAGYAWRQRAVAGARIYAGLACCECLLALAESLSMLSPTATAALFWFRVRYSFLALIPVLWLLFALEYGRQINSSKRLVAGLLVVPVVTQILQWSNGPHGLWVQQEVSMQRSGLFWIAQVGDRIPGPGFLFHAFYCIVLLSGGIALLFASAWRVRGLYRNQALLITGAAAVALAVTVIPTFNLIPQLQINPFTPGIGLSTLLAALATYRFAFLKRAPAVRPGSATPAQHSLAIFMFIFSLMTAGVATISYLSYHSYERQFRIQVENQLAGIAAFKVEELQDWRRERLGDAELFYGNPVFSALVQRMLEDPDDAPARAELQTWLDQYRVDEQYNRVFLLDTDGVEWISSPATHEPVAAHLIQEVGVVPSAGQVTFLDFYRDTEGGAIYLALLVPIFTEQDRRPLGMLVIRIDPYTYLYPYLQQWPIPSASAETALLRREGDTVLYLNALKFQSDAALNLRVSLENTTRPSVQATLGHEGIVEGINYRGVPVIAATRAVPDSPWFLAVREDRAEAYAPLRARLWQTVLFFGLLLAVSGTGLGLVWRQQRLRYYQEQVAAAQALRESEEKFRLLAETSPFGIYTYREKFIYVNPAFEPLTGYTVTELLGMNFWDLVHQDSRDMVRQRGAARLQGENVPDRYEIRLVRKDGNERWIDAAATVVQLGGEPTGIGILADITERKRAEESLRESEDKFKYVFEYSIIGKSITLPSGEINVNRAFCDMLGYTQEELQNRSWQEITHPDDIALTQSMIDSLLSGERDAARFTKRYLHKSGAAVWADVGTSLRRDEAGQPLYFITAINDITERKQVEAILRASEERYHAVVELQTELIDRWRPDGTLTFVNDAYCRYYGQPREALIGRKWMEVVAEGDQERVKEHVERLVACLSPANPTMTEEHQEIGVDGSIRWQQWTDQALFDEQGHLVELQSVGRDITERKQAENALRESEERYRQIIHVAYGVAYDFDWINDAYSFVESGIEQLTGYTPVEFTPTVFRAAIIRSENDTGGSEQDVTRTIPYRRADLLLRRKDGATVWVMDCAVRMRNDQGDVVRTIGIFQDITARKQAEEALRAALETANQSRQVLLSVIEDQKRTEEALAAERSLLRTLVDHLPDSIYVKDAACRKILANPANVRHIGIASEAEVLGKTDFDLFPPELAEKYYADDQYVIQSGQPVLNREEEVTQPDGSRGWQLTSKVPLRDSNGQVIGLVGIGHDITERKRAEEALAAERTLLRTMVDHLPDVVYVKDAAGRKTLSNPADVRNIGAASEAEALGKTDFDMFPPDLAEKYYADDQYVLQSGQPILNREEEIIHTDGARGWGMTSKMPLRDSDGQVIGLVGIGHDITERKQAEEMLRWAEERYRGLFEEAPLMYIITCSQEGVPIITDCNRAFTDTLGYARDEVIKRPLADLYTPESRAAVQEGGYRRALEGSFGSEERQLVARDGRIIETLLTALPETDVQGNVTGTRAMFVDVTDRKRAEGALAAERSLLRTLVDHLPDAVYVKDAARRKTLVNPADLRNMGVASEAEVLGKTDFDLFPPDLAAAFDADDQYVIQTGQPILNREEGITRPDGSRGWQLTSKVPLRDSNGQVIGLVGIGHDITERKQAEETLAAERLLLRAIIDIMPALVYVKDTTGRKILANPVDLDYMGVSTEAEALGKTDFDFYPQEMAAQFYDRDQAIMQTGQPLISYEHNLVRGDGQERWLLTSKVPLRDSTGQIIGLVGTGLDITERKRAEEALQESEERFHSLYENSTIGLYRTTLGGEILLANPALVKMLGYASFEALAARDLSKDGYGLMYNRAEFLEAVEKEGEIKGLESSWIRQDGQAIFIRESTRAIRDAQGKTLYYDGTVEDITERKRAQAEILRNAEQLATTIDVQHTLAATLDERAIWTRLGHGVQQLFPDMATVFISSYDPERTVISAEYGLQDGEPVDLSALPPILLSPPGRGTQSQVIHTRQPLVIASGLKERVSQGNVVVRVGEGEEDTQSAVYVPMLIQDKVLGVIQLQSYTPERFRETDVRLLALVANTAAVSIQNARLYALAQNEIAEREQAEQVIARRARELQTLYESSQQLKRTLDPEEIYHTIHHFIAQTIPCSGLFISDYSADPALITCRAAWNDGVWLDVADFPPIPLEPEGQGTQSVAIRTGQSLLLNDYERHVAASRARYYVDNEGALYEEVPDDAPRTRSALIVPLEVEGRVTGVIQVFSDSVNAFSEDHLHLLESLAIHIATSLQNAALYQAAQREITERKRTETMLREAQELYRSLFEQSPDAVFILDLQGQHIEVNARAAELLAYTKPELLTRSVREISAEPDKSTEILNRLQAGEAIPPYEQLFRRKDGSLVPVELHISLIRDSQGRPLQIQSIARDITERKRAAELLRMYTEQLEALVAERTRALEEAQERLLRQERLTVLGQVAGGIAHELRTPLGAIKNSIYLLNMLLEPSDATVQEVLAVINQEIGASDRIISSLLNFTRPQRPARQIVDVHQVVEQALVRIEIPPQFQVQRHFAQDMPAILADAVQLEQVFGNLILNATQAMSQEGQLTIQTGQIHSLPENVEAGFMPTDEAHAAGWVVVSISDTGDGISPKHLAQLFQPLFTTKSKGMGLGLALVKLLTEANGGGIAVESTLGKGTTFHTFWPIATQ